MMRSNSNPSIRSRRSMSVSGRGALWTLPSNQNVKQPQSSRYIDRAALSKALLSISASGGRDARYSLIFRVSPAITGMEIVTAKARINERHMEAA